MPACHICPSMQSCEEWRLFFFFFLSSGETFISTWGFLGTWVMEFFFYRFRPSGNDQVAGCFGKFSIRFFHKCICIYMTSPLTPYGVFPFLWTQCHCSELLLPRVLIYQKAQNERAAGYLQLACSDNPQKPKRT